METSPLSSFALLHLFTCFAFVAQCIKLHQQPQNFAAFWVLPEETGQVSVKKETSTGDTLACTFTYDTRTTKSPDGEAERRKVASKTPQQLLSWLDESACVESDKAASDHNYKLCLGRQLTQQINKRTMDEVSLGKFVGWDGPVQRYEGGSPKYCSRHNRKRKKGATIERTTRVHFVCQPKTKLHIVSVEEFTTCSYIITLGLNEVCGHPDFITVKPVAVEEYWTMELLEGVQGHVVTVKESSEKTTNYIDKFSLQCEANGSPAPLSAQRARHGDRLSLPPHLFQASDEQIVASGMAELEFNFVEARVG